MIFLHRFFVLSQGITLFGCVARGEGEANDLDRRAKPIDKPDRKTRDQVTAKVEPRPLPQNRRDGGVIYETDECDYPKRIKIKAYRHYEDSTDFVEVYKGENADVRDVDETVNEDE